VLRRHELLDKSRAFVAERNDGGIEFVGNPIDADKQCELSLAQRVEDLAVVVTCPHLAPVGHDAQASEIEPGVAYCSHREPRPRGGHARAEQCVHDA
jgi:hypothetical protein